MNPEVKLQELYPDAKDIRRKFCPYRVCPIGAHVDHQLGRITGFAINEGIEILYTPTDDGSIDVTSLNFDGNVTFNAIKPPKNRAFDWADYLRGAANRLGSDYDLKKGIKGVLHGSLPIGGLSSSASVTIAFLLALADANDIELTRPELIKMAILVENKFVGISCGKLDPSCEVYAKKDSMLYFDAKDDSFEVINKPENMKPFQFAIFFSGVERTLVGSKFNTRVDELKSAAYSLMARSGMNYGSFDDAVLRDVPKEIFENHKHELPENFRKRAEHYYTEQDRVINGRKAFLAGDIEEYGRLSFESGKSSIVNFEAGSPELIALYNAMRTTDGIYGGRFSGAGFKGCCMALVDPTFKDHIVKEVTRKYLKEFPELEGKFSIHFCDTADGVQL